MKSLTLMAIYIASFILVFFMLSSIGWLFTGSYVETISSHNWQFIYTIFFGWWMSIFPTREYYMKHEDYFQRVL
jgi:hypothetical protein